MSSREWVAGPVCRRDAVGAWTPSSTLVFPVTSPVSPECNASLCKEKPPVCPLGFDVKSEMLPGRCCPFHSCGKWPGCGTGGTSGPRAV